jgi:hypothetical protein
MGDVFVHRPKRLLAAESVLFLNAMTGSLEHIAKNYRELRQLLGCPEQAAPYLLPALVAELRSRGSFLAPGQCYSPNVLPALGGTMDPDNFAPVDWHVHLAIAGQIHQQIKDLPDGAQIKFKVVP